MAENISFDTSKSLDATADAAPDAAADAPVAIKKVINPHDLITRKDVEICLKNDRGQSAFLQSFEIIDFTKKGDNYTCFVTSVLVKFQNKRSKDIERSYVVKVNCVKSGFGKAISALFKKEVGFYTEVLPALNEELNKINEPPLRVPTYFHNVAREHEQLIYMEDLRKIGFEMVDRKKGMEKEHTDLVLKELARFHGASILLISKGEFKISDLKLRFPTLAEPFELYKDEDGPSGSKNFFKKFVMDGIKMAESCGYDNVVKFLEPKLTTIFDDYKNQLKATEQFKVICHGDCWNNNFLFRRDPKTRKLIDCRLLDMQVTRVGSLVLDITYMLNCSLIGDVRKSRLDSFLNVYHTKFTSMLAAADIATKFSISQLKEEYHRKGLFGLLSALMAIPMLLSDSEDVPEGSQALLERNVEKLSEKNPKLKKRFVELFDEMIEAGVIH